MTGGRLVALAWSPFQARTKALASDLDGEAHFVAGGRLRGHRLLLPLRYLRDAIATWRYLDRRKPSVVLVITPPVFAPAVAWLWCGLRGRPFVVDCHTLALHSPKWGWALPVHRFLLRRARAVLLHTREGEAEVHAWGAEALLVPDELPDPTGAVAVEPTMSPRVLVAGSLDWDEPVTEVVAAARLIPAVQLRITGDLARLTADVRQTAPSNVVFTGWLDYPNFLGEIKAADVVAAFTGLPGVMNRAAFEAIGMGRPLVLSDLPGMRERFGEAAVFTKNAPLEIAQSITRAYEDRDRLSQASESLKSELRRARSESLARLRALLASRKPRALRVLLVSRHPYPDAPLLRRNVQHLVDQGVRLDLVSARPVERHTNDRLAPGFRIFALPVRHRRRSWFQYLVEDVGFFLLALPLVSWLSLRHRYDAVQIDNPPDFLPFVALLPRLRGARVVFYMYDMFPELAMTRLRLPSKHPLISLARIIERSAVHWVDHAVVVSDLFRRTLIGRGINPGKISIVYNTQPLAVTMRRSAAGPPRLVTHATLVERYGVQVAIRALPYLRRAWPDLKFEVLGRGEYLDALKELAADLGVSDMVTFSGFLPWPEAMERISSATVGVVPVIADGFGEFILPMKLLEYVGIGIPVVCARLPGIAEHFDEKALAFFTPGDSEELARRVDALLRDPVGAQQQAAQASQEMEAIRWETVAPRYLAALTAAT